MKNCARKVQLQCCSSSSTSAKFCNLILLIFSPFNVVAARSSVCNVSSGFVQIQLPVRPSVYPVPFHDFGPGFETRWQNSWHATSVAAAAAMVVVIVDDDPTKVAFGIERNGARVVLVPPRSVLYQVVAVRDWCALSAL